MQFMPAPEDNAQVFSVSQLTRSVRRLLESNFGQVWVEGELSNFATPHSGHWYFTLKDNAAQLRCAMFASRNRSVKFNPRDGLKVLIRGRLSIYEGRGDFQAIVDRLEPAGEGALRLAFEELKNQLGVEGLFAAESKRSLPRYPAHMVIISSGTGAAYQDVLSVLRRRYPTILTSFIPVAVQGPESERGVLRALERISDWVSTRSPPPGAENSTVPDLVLITRGGGSLEDLWTFNLESVARALAACPIPTVSAIGHETDFTISDFVSDLRAPTPSAAAEMITPDSAELKSLFIRLRQSLLTAMNRSVASQQQHLHLLAKSLVHPGQKLQQQMQRLDELQMRLEHTTTRQTVFRINSLSQLRTRLLGYHPLKDFVHARQNLGISYRRLIREMHNQLKYSNAKLRELSRTLHSVSPLETLTRGYAIVTEPSPEPGRWGTSICSVHGIVPGDPIVTHLNDGALSCTVDAIAANSNLTPDEENN